MGTHPTLGTADALLTKARLQLQESRDSSSLHTATVPPRLTRAFYCACALCLNLRRPASLNAKIVIFPSRPASSSPQAHSIGCFVKLSRTHCPHFPSISGWQSVSLWSFGAPEGIAVLSLQSLLLMLHSGSL